MVLFHSSLESDYIFAWKINPSVRNKVGDIVHWLIFECIVAAMFMYYSAHVYRNRDTIRVIMCPGRKSIGEMLKYIAF